MLDSWVVVHRPSSFMNVNLQSHSLTEQFGIPHQRVSPSLYWSPALSAQAVRRHLCSLRKKSYFWKCQEWTQPTEAERQRELQIGILRETSKASRWFTAKIFIHTHTHTHTHTHKPRNLLLTFWTGHNFNVLIRQLSLLHLAHNVLHVFKTKSLGRKVCLIRKELVSCKRKWRRERCECRCAMCKMCPFAHSWTISLLIARDDTQPRVCCAHHSQTRKICKSLTMHENKAKEHAPLQSEASPGPQPQARPLACRPLSC